MPKLRRDNPKYWAKQHSEESARLKSFRYTAKDIYSIYEQQKTRAQGLIYGDVNILWANTQIERSFCYSNVPKVATQARFSPQNKIASLMAKIARNACQYQLSERSDFHDSLVLAVESYLVAGLGQVRVRYAPTQGTEVIKIPVMPAGDGYVSADGQPVDPNKVKQGSPGELYIETIAADVIFEDVNFEFIPYHGFAFEESYDWNKVSWVSFRNYLRYDEVESRFGAKIAEKLTYDMKAYRDHFNEQEENLSSEKTCVIEYWDKLDRKVRWMSPQVNDDFLGESDDPLGLRDFFPCPKPLLCNSTATSLLGKPDYKYYEAHARELEKVCAKRYQLLKFVAVKGIGDLTAKDVLLPLIETDQNHIAFVDMPNFMANGGLETALQLLDMTPAMNQIVALTNQEQVLLQRIYEITGVSDILRGQVNPYESAEASKTKSSYAGLRLGLKKQTVANFCKDLINLAAEIIVEKFQPSTIQLISDAESFQPEELAEFNQALELLKKDGLRRIKIEIETDSTVALDRQEKRQEFNEYLNTVQAFMGNVLPLIQQNPAYGPYFVELLLRGCRMFALGQEVESSLSAALNQTVQSAVEASQQPPQPSPEQLLNDAKIEKLKAEAQAILDGVSISAQKVANSKAMGETMRDSSAAKLAIAAEKIKQDWDVKQLEMLK